MLEALERVLVSLHTVTVVGWGMGYRPQSEDTTREIERVQFAIYARMTPGEKIARVRQLCRMANRLALAGLRQRHPGESESRLQWRLAAIRLGDELAARIRPPSDE